MYIRYYLIIPTLNITHYILLTRTLCICLQTYTFNLHVLSTFIAFILSQDQTLLFFLKIKFTINAFFLNTSGDKRTRTANHNHAKVLLYLIKLYPPSYKNQIFNSLMVRALGC